MIFAREFLPDATEWAKAPLAVIDFETTGLDHHEDRIIEVGVVYLTDGEVSNRVSWRVNAGIWVPDEVVGIHGISTHALVNNNHRGSLESLVALYDYFKGRLPVAYNMPFDRRFLHAEARRHGMYRGNTVVPPAFRYGVEWIDVLVWLRHLEPELKVFRLSEVCQKLDVPLPHAHSAVEDAAATAKLLLRLEGRMPANYGELIRDQVQLAVAQKVDRDLEKLRPPTAPVLVDKR